MKTAVIALLFILPGLFISAQVSISDDNGLPDQSAALDVNFLNKGFLLPRLTKAQRDAEWCQMEYFLDATVNCSAIGWIGTNSSGLTFLPGGYRELTGGYYSLFISGNFWTTAEYNSENAYNRGLGYANAGSYRSYGPKPAGFSARCCKD